MDIETSDPCPKCGGSGEVPEYVYASLWNMVADIPDRVIFVACRTCNGSGRVTKPKRKYVRRS